MVVSDVIVLYVLKKRKYYKENKYQEVKDSDMEFDYEVITNPPPPDIDHQYTPPTVSTALLSLKVKEVYCPAGGVCAHFQTVFYVFLHFSLLLRTPSIIHPVVLVVVFRTRVTNSESKLSHWST